MKCLGGGFEIKSIAARPEVLLETGLGGEQRFEAVAVTEEKIALVGAVVPRQQVGLARFTRTEPGAVAEDKVRPADQALRIGIFHRGTHGRPIAAMRFYQRLRPVRIRKTMV